MWPFRTAVQTKQVGLFLYNGDMVIRTAYLTEAGYIASSHPALEDSWYLLLPDGKVRGANLVESWIKISGWDNEKTS